MNASVAVNPGCAVQVASDERRALFAFLPLTASACSALFRLTDGGVRAWPRGVDDKVDWPRAVTSAHAVPMPRTTISPHNKAVIDRRLRPLRFHLQGSYFKRPKSSPVRPLACHWYYCAQFIAKHCASAGSRATLAYEQT